MIIRVVLELMNSCLHNCLHAKDVNVNNAIFGIVMHC